MWPSQPFGRYLLDWEQRRCDEATADIFGYHGLQLGMPALHGLRANRMPRRWLAALTQPSSAPVEAVAQTQGGGPHLACHPEALPFADNSMDLVILPHTLEHCADAYQTLREVARVLVPQGRVLIFGLNPVSLRGLQDVLERPLHPGRTLPAGLPDAVRYLTYWRLRDWLRLLDIETVALDFGCHAPVTRSAGWLRRWQWLDSVGQRLWPAWGGVYCMLAAKQVPGMWLLGPAWRHREARAGAAPAPAGMRAAQGGATGPVDWAVARLDTLEKT